MPEAEFRAQWAGARKPAGDAELGDDPHAVMLARLSHELTSRCGYLGLPEAQAQPQQLTLAAAQQASATCWPCLAVFFTLNMAPPPSAPRRPLHHCREETVKQADAIKAKRDVLAADVAQKRSRLSALEAEVAKLRAAAQVRWAGGWGAGGCCPPPAGPLCTGVGLAEELSCWP